MKVGELFVNLGLKGADTTLRGLTGVKSGLGGIAEGGLAAKAAILAVFYGIERITSAAGQAGMELKQFGAATGLSTQSLQKWQYAARQFGVDGNEIASTAKSIQNAMTNMLLGKGAPEGMAMLANTVGFDPARARDTFYVMEQLQKFSKSVPPDVANNILKSFGVSDNVFAFMRQNRMEIEKIKPSNLFSDKQIESLARVDVAWKNLWYTLKLFSGGEVAKFGLDMVGHLQRAFKTVSQLNSGFQKMAKELPLIKDLAVAIAVAIGAAFAPITATVLGLVYIMSEWQKFKGQEDSTVFGPGTKKFFKTDEQKKQWAGMMDAFAANPDYNKNLAPSGNKVEINQSITHNGDAKDTKAVKDLHKTSINNAFRQFNAVGQGG